MKQLQKRTECKNGVSLSIQASSYHYCEPRINDLGSWKNYEKVEVGFIHKENYEISPPPDWRQYAEGEFPSSVYAYVPVGLVKAFIEENGGEL